MIESKKPTGKAMRQLNCRITISKNAIHFAALFLVAADRCSGATWEGTDDFSWGISPTNWTFFSESSGEEVTVVGANGHASFIVPALIPGEDKAAAIVWRGKPTAAEGWTVEVTGHHSATPSQLQFPVLRTDGALTSNREAFVITRRQGADGGSFDTDQWHTNRYTPRATVSATNADFGLRLVYRSTSRVIEAWYDPDASGLAWTKLDAISLAEFSPSMTASNTFTFAVNAVADHDNAPITEGQLWADNFRLTASSPMPPPLVVAGAQWAAGFEFLHLRWTNNGSSCVMESAGAVTGAWGAIVTPWITNAGWISTTVSNSSPAQFYRLRGS
jgi:hypothetical protein